MKLLNPIKTVSRFEVLALLLIFLPCIQGISQEASGSVLIPGPAPFSLDAVSAIDCIALLKNSRYLERDNETGDLIVVEVETVWSWFLDHDESFPKGHRNRYDIIVNGEALDWDNSYFEYGNDLVNLRLLFLYRNQHPPESFGDYLLKDF